jgi:RND family efflux transporter MFP subunit
MENANTALDIALSELKVAEFNLRHSAIYAPENGKILKKFAEDGELIAAGIPVFLYGANQQGWVIRAGVTDRQILRLQLGDGAEITFDVYPDRVFPAKISEIEAVANPYTGTFEVEFQLQPSNDRFYSGFIGRVKILPKNRQEYSFIPIEALIESEHNSGYVFEALRTDNRVKKHEIKIGQIVDGQLAVVDGLENINEVVTYGTPYLTNNSIIEIVE